MDLLFDLAEPKRLEALMGALDAGDGEGAIRSGCPG